MTRASPARDENGGGDPGSAAILAARAGWKPVLPAERRSIFRATSFPAGEGGTTCLPLVGSPSRQSETARMRITRRTAVSRQDKRKGPGDRSGRMGGPAQAASAPRVARVTQAASPELNRIGRHVAPRGAPAVPDPAYSTRCMRGTSRPTTTPRTPASTSATASWMST